MHLATHYPSASHSFIATEIDHLRQLGLTVHTAAINPPTEASLLSDRDHEARATTFYLKAVSWISASAALAGACRRHPVRLLRCAYRVLSIDMFDLPSTFKRTMQFGEALVLWRHCAKQGITAIHAHFGQAPATIAWYTTEIGRAVDGRPWTWSVTIHGWTEFVIEDRAQLKHKLRTADLVVCVSDYTKSQLQRIGDRATWDKIHVVRCGIDLDRFALREPRPVPAVPTVVVTARLSEEKGHFVLLQAAAQLRDQGVRLRLRFVGPGHLAGAIAERAQELGMADDVQLLGALPPARVREELLAADIFCLPTSAEGLPVALMEAMAIGLPVVTTFISGIPELVIDGVTGCVVPAARADLIARSIASVLDAPGRSAEMITTAREHVARHHDARATARELFALLSSSHQIEAWQPAPTTTLLSMTVD